MPEENVNFQIITCSIEVRLSNDGTADLRVTGDSALDGKVNIDGDLTVEGKIEGKEARLQSRET